jgi:hypothetical protein
MAGEFLWELPGKWREGQRRLQRGIERQPAGEKRRLLNCVRSNGTREDEEVVAGVVGFEPTIHGTKNRCLTTWLHPKSGMRDTQGGAAPQA